MLLSTCSKDGGGQDHDGQRDSSLIRADSSYQRDSSLISIQRELIKG